MDSEKQVRMSTRCWSVIVLVALSTVSLAPATVGASDESEEQRGDSEHECIATPFASALCDVLATLSFLSSPPGNPCLTLIELGEGPLAIDAEQACADFLMDLVQPLADIAQHPSSAPAAEPGCEIITLAASTAAPSLEECLPGGDVTAELIATLLALAEQAIGIAMDCVPDEIVFLNSQSTAEATPACETVDETTGAILDLAAQLLEAILADLSGTLACVLDGATPGPSGGPVTNLCHQAAQTLDDLLPIIIGLVNAIRDTALDAIALVVECATSDGSPVQLPGAPLGGAEAENVEQCDDVWNAVNTAVELAMEALEALIAGSGACLETFGIGSLRETDPSTDLAQACQQAYDAIDDARQLAEQAITQAVQTAQECLALEEGPGNPACDVAWSVLNTVIEIAYEIIADVTATVEACAGSIDVDAQAPSDGEPLVDCEGTVAQVNAIYHEVEQLVGGLVGQVSDQVARCLAAYGATDPGPAEPAPDFLTGGPDMCAVGWQAYDAIVGKLGECTLDLLELREAGGDGPALNSLASSCTSAVVAKVVYYAGVKDGARDELTDEERAFFERDDYDQGAQVTAVDPSDFDLEQAKRNLQNEVDDAVNREYIITTVTDPIASTALAATQLSSSLVDTIRCTARLDESEPPDTTHPVLETIMAGRDSIGEVTEDGRNPIDASVEIANIIVDGTSQIMETACLDGWLPLDPFNLVETLQDQVVAALEPTWLLDMVQLPAVTGTHQVQAVASAATQAIETALATIDDVDIHTITNPLLDSIARVDLAPTLGPGASLETVSSQTLATIVHPDLEEAIRSLHDRLRNQLPENAIPEDSPEAVHAAVAIRSTAGWRVYQLTPDIESCAEVPGRDAWNDDNGCAYLMTLAPSAGGIEPTGPTFVPSEFQKVTVAATNAARTGSLELAMLLPDPLDEGYVLTYAAMNQATPAGLPRSIEMDPLMYFANGRFGEPWLAAQWIFESGPTATGDTTLLAAGLHDVPEGENVTLGSQYLVGRSVLSSLPNDWLLQVGDIPNLGHGFSYVSTQTPMLTEIQIASRQGLQGTSSSIDVEGSAKAMRALWSRTPTLQAVEVATSSAVSELILRESVTASGAQVGGVLVEASEFVSLSFYSDSEDGTTSYAATGPAPRASGVLTSTGDECTTLDSVANQLVTDTNRCSSFAVEGRESIVLQLESDETIHFESSGTRSDIAVALLAPRSVYLRALDAPATASLTISQTPIGSNFTWVGSEPWRGIAASVDEGQIGRWIEAAVSDAAPSGYVTWSSNPATLKAVSAGSAATIAYAEAASDTTRKPSWTGSYALAHFEPSDDRINMHLEDVMKLFLRATGNSADARCSVANSAGSFMQLETSTDAWAIDAAGPCKGTFTVATAAVGANSFAAETEPSDKVIATYTSKAPALRFVVEDLDGALTATIDSSARTLAVENSDPLSNWAFEQGALGQAPTVASNELAFATPGGLAASSGRFTSVESISVQASHGQPVLITVDGPNQVPLRVTSISDVGSRTQVSFEDARGESTVEAIPGHITALLQNEGKQVAFTMVDDSTQWSVQGQAIELPKFDTTWQWNGGILTWETDATGAANGQLQFEEVNAQTQDAVRMILVNPAPHVNLTATPGSGEIGIRSTAADGSPTPSARVDALTTAGRLTYQAVPALPNADIIYFRDAGIERSVHVVAADVERLAGRAWDNPEAPVERGFVFERSQPRPLVVDITDELEESHYRLSCDDAPATGAFVFSLPIDGSFSLNAEGNAPWNLCDTSAENALGLLRVTTAEGTPQGFNVRHVVDQLVSITASGSMDLEFSYAPDGRSPGGPALQDYIAYDSRGETSTGQFSARLRDVREMTIDLQAGSFTARNAEPHALLVAYFGRAISFNAAIEDFLGPLQASWNSNGSVIDVESPHAIDSVTIAASQAVAGPWILGIEEMPLGHLHAQSSEIGDFVAMEASSLVGDVLFARAEPGATLMVPQGLGIRQLPSGSGGLEWRFRNVESFAFDFAASAPRFTAAFSPEGMDDQMVFIANQNVSPTYAAQVSGASPEFALAWPARDSPDSRAFEAFGVQGREIAISFEAGSTSSLWTIAAAAEDVSLRHNLPSVIEATGSGQSQGWSYDGNLAGSVIHAQAAGVPSSFAARINQSGDGSVNAGPGDVTDLVLQMTVGSPDGSIAKPASDGDHFLLDAFTDTPSVSVQIPTGRSVVWSQLHDELHFNMMASIGSSAVFGITNQRPDSQLNAGMPNGYAARTSIDLLHETGWQLDVQGDGKIIDAVFRTEVEGFDFRVGPISDSFTADYNPGEGLVQYAAGGPSEELLLRSDWADSAFELRGSEGVPAKFDVLFDGESTGSGFVKTASGAFGNLDLLFIPDATAAANMYAGANEFFVIDGAAKVPYIKANVSGFQEATWTLRDTASTLPLQFTWGQATTGATVSVLLASLRDDIEFEIRDASPHTEFVITPKDIVPASMMKVVVDSPDQATGRLDYSYLDLRTGQTINGAFEDFAGRTTLSARGMENPVALYSSTVPIGGVYFETLDGNRHYVLDVTAPTVIIEAGLWGSLCGDPTREGAPVPVTVTTQGTGQTGAFQWIVAEDGQAAIPDAVTASNTDWFVSRCAGSASFVTVVTDVMELFAFGDLEPQDIDDASQSEDLCDRSGVATTSGDGRGTYAEWVGPDQFIRFEFSKAEADTQGFRIGENILGRPGWNNQNQGYFAFEEGTVRIEELTELVISGLTPCMEWVDVTPILLAATGERVPSDLVIEMHEDLETAWPNGEGHFSTLYLRSPSFETTGRLHLAVKLEPTDRLNLHEANFRIESPVEDLDVHVRDGSVVRLHEDRSDVDGFQVVVLEDSYEYRLDHENLERLDGFAFRPCTTGNLLDLKVEKLPGARRIPSVDHVDLGDCTRAVLLFDAPTEYQFRIALDDLADAEFDLDLLDGASSQFEFYTSRLCFTDEFCPDFGGDAAPPADLGPEGLDYSGFDGGNLWYKVGFYDIPQGLNTLSVHVSPALAEVQASARDGQIDSIELGLYFPPLDLFWGLRVGDLHQFRLVLGGNEDISVFEIDTGSDWLGLDAVLATGDWGIGVRPGGAFIADDFHLRLIHPSACLWLLCVPTGWPALQIGGWLCWATVQLWLQFKTPASDDWVGLPIPPWPQVGFCI